jgi:hypothetical protein
LVPSAVVGRTPSSTARLAPTTPSAPTTAAASSAPTTAPSTAPTTTTTVPPGPDELAALNAPQLTASLLTQQVPANLRPSLRQARRDLPAIYRDGCHLDVGATVPGPCAFGDPASPTTIVLFGDSHAAQWFPALEQIATQRHWRLLVMTKKGCPPADVAVYSPLVNRELRECDPWRVNVAQRLGREHPALVVMTSYRYRQAGRSAGIGANEAWRRGLTTTLDAIRPLSARVLVLGDTPTPAHDVPACLSAHLGHVGACVASRTDAVRDDRLAVERDVATAHQADFVTTSGWLCAPEGCPVIVGDVLVYRDGNHVTATAARWLSPYLDAAVTRALG